MSLLTLLHRIPLPPEAPGIFVEPRSVYVLTINGVPKTMRPGWSISETANGRNTFACEVLSLDGTYRPPIGAEVLLTEDGVRIFGGIIETPSESGIGSKGFTAIATRISAIDFNALADRRTVTATLGGGTLRLYLEILSEWLNPFGVWLDPGQATGPIMPSATYQARLLRDILDEWSIVSGYLWEIDYTRILRMFLPNTVTAPFNLLVDHDRNIEGDITVEPSRANFAQAVTLLCGGTDTEPKMQVFIADGQQHGGFTRYVADYPATMDIQTLWPNRAILNDIAIGPAWWAPNGIAVSFPGGSPEWLWDPVAHTFIHNDAFGLTPAGTRIRIDYMAQYPFEVRVLGAPLGPDFAERTYEVPNVKDLAVGRALAQSYLARAMLTPKTIRYTTRYKHIHPGQQQSVLQAKRNLSGTYLVTDVRIANTEAWYVRRQVTAVEGSILPETSRDAFRQWTGSGASSAPAALSGAVTVATTGGVAGGGSVNRLARWATPNVLSDSLITDNGAVVSVAGVLTANQFSGGGSGLTGLTAESLTGTLPASVLIPRSLADLGTRSAGDLALGNLAYARLPTGEGVWVAAPTIQGLLTLLAGLATTTVTATGAVTAADVHVSVNNTAYKVRNAANTADLPVVTADASNLTTVFCNSARLRFANPSTGAAPAGTPLGVLNVTIDGIGDVAIPYY